MGAGVKAGLQGCMLTGHRLRLSDLRALPGCWQIIFLVGSFEDLKIKKGTASNGEG